MKNNLKQNVSIESFNHILVLFSFVNYDKIRNKKTPTSIIVRVGVLFCAIPKNDGGK
jgi:hypothetical protein